MIQDFLSMILLLILLGFAFSVMVGGTAQGRRFLGWVRGQAVRGVRWCGRQVAAFLAAHPAGTGIVFLIILALVFGRC